MDSDDDVDTMPRANLASPKSDIFHLLWRSALNQSFATALLAMDTMYDRRTTRRDAVETPLLNSFVKGLVPYSAGLLHAVDTFYKSHHPTVVP
jgi:hypothetical protein